MELQPEEGKNTKRWMLIGRVFLAEEIAAVGMMVVRILGDGLVMEEIMGVDEGEMVVVACKSMGICGRGHASSGPVASVISTSYSRGAKEVLLRKANLQTRVLSSRGRFGERENEVGVGMLDRCILNAVFEHKGALKLFAGSENAKGVH